MKKCLIAMSGGVDSSVAARLLLDAGVSCVGGSLLLHGEEDPTRDAERVASQMGLAFCAFDCREEFRQKVMGDFARCYAEGATPNPCIRCNRHMKFRALLERAGELGCSHIATGHYARVEYHEGLNRYLLRKAADESKDQSYVLYSLTQEQLSHVIFPLGELTKAEIRQKAEEYGLFNAHKKDSQDICFIPDGDYAAFLERFTATSWPEGDFVDTEGKVLGKHKGIVHYTIGQRRGLGIAAEHPLYVLQILPGENKVVLGKNEELFKRELTAKNVNLIAMEAISAPLRCTAKIRYRHEAAPCTATMEGDTLRVCFDEPQRAITPGQSVVLYDGDYVLGGGIIE